MSPRLLLPANALDGLGIVGVVLRGRDCPKDLDRVLAVEGLFHAQDHGAMTLEASELLRKDLIRNPKSLAIVVGDDQNNALLNIQTHSYQAHANALDGRFLGPEEGDALIEASHLSPAQKAEPVFLR